MGWDFKSTILWVKYIDNKVDGYMSSKKYSKLKEGGPSVSWMEKEIGNWGYVMALVEGEGDKEILKEYMCKSCPKEESCGEDGELCYKLAKRTGYMVDSREHSGYLKCNMCGFSVEKDDLFELIKGMNKNCPKKACKGKMLAGVIVEKEGCR